MPKYSPLQAYLSALTAGTQNKTITFEQIENILNFKLPPSAREHRAWWANDGTHVHARSWLNIGWKVYYVNFSAKWVEFIKTGGILQTKVDTEFSTDILQTTVDTERSTDILRIIDLGISDITNGRIEYMSLEDCREKLCSDRYPSILNEEIPTFQDHVEYLSLPEEYFQVEELPLSVEETGTRPKSVEVEPINDNHFPLAEISEQREKYDIGFSDDFIHSLGKLDAKLRGRILDA